MEIMHVHVLPPRTSCLLVPALSVVLLLAMAPVAHTDEPPVFAISNARIVTVAGPPVEKGTIILRNGIIEAVGAGIAIPGDARVIDGTGMTVYPGLIDALSDAGLEETRPQTPPATTRPPGAPSPAAPAAQQSTQSPDERQGLTPYRQAVEMINPAHRKIEAARAAGITTALVAPRGGIFTGQGSLINLSGGDLGRMVIKTPVAFHIQMASASGGFARDYPGSLMGIIAFVKQTLLDAGHYGTSWTIYNANPGSMRPLYSRALDSLQPLIRRESRVVLSADDPTEIRRALDLAGQFKLDLILSGGAEAKGIAAVLKERNIPVLLSVKYPERDRDPDPEMKDELEVLRRRVEAPANAAALAKAGVKFAFQSGDMADPKDFIRNVGRAVEAGLNKDTALRALTLTPAEIFGVSDRLGSIEKNKTANLIVTTGDIFDAKTKVKIAFVDGRKFDIAEPVEPPARGTEDGAQGGESSEVAGTWTLTVDSPQGAVSASMILQQAGSVVTGTVSSYMGEMKIENGTFSGGKLAFRVTVNTMSISFSGTVQGARITGTIDAGPMGTMECTGSKKPGGSFAEEEAGHEN